MGFIPLGRLGRTDWNRAGQTERGGALGFQYPLICFVSRKFGSLAKEIQQTCMDMKKNEKMKSLVYISFWPCCMDSRASKVRLFARHKMLPQSRNSRTLAGTHS